MVDFVNDDPNTCSREKTSGNPHFPFPTYRTWTNLRNSCEILAQENVAMLQDNLRDKKKVPQVLQVVSKKKKYVHQNRHSMHIYYKIRICTYTSITLYVCTMHA